MKTDIVPIELYDDVYSIRDKLMWCRTGRILLVLPKQHRPFPGKIDLHLINRSGRKHGAVLGVVCRDLATRQYASELGIPVFRSTPEAERSRWPVISTDQKGVGIIRGKETLAEIRKNLPVYTEVKTTANRLVLALLYALMITIVFFVSIQALNNDITLSQIQGDPEFHVFGWLNWLTSEVGRLFISVGR